MAYAAVQDLIAAYGERKLIQLTDRAEPPAEVVDELVAGAALTDATDLIDGYVRGAYALPLASTPPVLRTLCADIAWFRLMGDSPTEEARKRYEDALRQLRDISAGRIKLPVEGGAEPAARPSVIQTTGSSRLFSRESLRDA